MKKYRIIVIGKSSVFFFVFFLRGGGVWGVKFSIYLNRRVFVMYAIVRSA